MRDGLAVNLGDLLQLNDIETALTELTLRKEGTGFAHPIRHIFLKQTCVMTCFNEASQKRLVRPLVRSIAFVHLPRLREA